MHRTFRGAKVVARTARRYTSETFSKVPPFVQEAPSSPIDPPTAHTLGDGGTEEPNREPVQKWQAIERDRRGRFGTTWSSGRGRSGETPFEEVRSTRSLSSTFRSTGLAYHAWEKRLEEKPLPAMPILTSLRRKNATQLSVVNDDVISILRDVTTLSGAFMSMYCRHGSMEEAQSVLHSRAISWIEQLCLQLRDGRYEFPIVSQLEPKSMDQPKYDGTLHEVPPWWHKTIPEAIRLTLEAVFEPHFLKSAHGYRPGKGCYTALKEVKYGFAGVDYLIVGDLSRCLETFDQTILLNAIRERISDPAFLRLVEKCLAQDYVDLSVVDYKNIGLPQPTLLGPILCNIYLHALDVWLQNWSQCLSVGGDVRDAAGNIYAVVENRRRFGMTRLEDARAWKSPTLQGVRYVRYGNTFLIGVHGSDSDVDQFEVDLARFIKTRLHLSYKQFQYNRALATSPDKEYVVFLGAEVYVAPQISSPGLHPASSEAGQLPNRPRLCVPARLLMKKLEENGFVETARKRPRYCHRLVMWECHEIVKYYDIVIKLFCMYYTFADNYHCLLLLYDVMKQSCSLTLARKLRLKRMWHVHKRLEKDLIVRDMEGVALASFERPRFERPFDPFVGRDVNPFVRIERPSRPKFPPVKLGEAFHEPQFPMSKMERSVRSKILDGQQS